MKMKASVKQAAIITAGVLIVAAVLVPSVLKLREMAKRTRCRSSIHSTDLALQNWSYPLTNYPSSLSQVSIEDLHPLCLICSAVPPSDKERYYGIMQEADMAEMDKWTDFIYVSGIDPETTEEVPLIICPPVNHGDKGGNVLFANHRLQWVASPESDRLIDWTYAYAESNGLRVVVSEALQKRSGGKYKSSP